MRQGQQNRRSRGRNTNNRKGQSPLTRSFESNGPDVKIRGTPAHIGEKYMSLARDAAASGDPVLAENYLQHAEHYNRIIMAAREQFSQGPDGMNGAVRHRSAQGVDSFESSEDWGDEADEDFSGDMPPAPRQFDPAPRASEGDLRREPQRHEDRPFRRGNDFNRSQQRERHGGEQRGYALPRPANRPEPASGNPAASAEQPSDSFPQGPRNDAPSRRRERYQPPEHEQPEFLRRSVRRPRREANGVEPEGEAGNGTATTSADDDGGK